ncbi:MAG: phage tail sheath protein FI, partial [Myxococcota bacterium]
GLLIMPVLAYLPSRVEPDGTVVVAAEHTYGLLLDHCREMNNRFLVLDAPKDLHEHELLSWVAGFRKRNAEKASYAAIYYPWLMQGDSTFPPSGAVAGVFARVEREAAPFGVRNPPANEVLKGVTHPAVPLRWTETEEFLGAHINLLISSPARGVLVWGARTLSTAPQWRHINSRRIVSMLAEQLRRDNEWVIFENQRPQLWDIVRRTVSGRLSQFWGAGLLTGDKAGSDYLVQCDKETNPPEIVDAGQVHVRVQVRPISTTEFVVVDLRLGD